MTLFGKKTRPLDLYEFEGQKYRKGDLIVAVLRDHIKKKKPKLDELKATFKEADIRNYGLFLEEKIAKEKSGRYKRFLLDEGRIIEMPTGERIAVCSQLTKENVKPFLEVAKKLGYKISSG